MFIGWIVAQVYAGWAYTRPTTVKHNAAHVPTLPFAEDDRAHHTNEQSNAELDFYNIEDSAEIESNITPKRITSSTLTAIPGLRSKLNRRK